MTFDDFDYWRVRFFSDWDSLESSFFSSVIFDEPTQYTSIDPLFVDDVLSVFYSFYSEFCLSNDIEMNDDSLYLLISLLDIYDEYVYNDAIGL